MEFITDSDLTRETVESTQSSEGTSSSLGVGEIIGNYTETIKKQLALFSLKLQEKNVVNRKVQTFVVNEVSHFISISLKTTGIFFLNVCRL